MGDNENSADIRFGWKNIDGPGGILGQASIPSNGPLENVVVALDQNESWFLGGDAPPDKIDFSTFYACPVQVYLYQLYNCCKKCSSFN